METSTIALEKNFTDQKPGTSGLRKKTVIFKNEKGYVESFVQSTLNAVGISNLAGSTLVVGGDGRYYNSLMIQTIISMCAANGIHRIWVGKDGLLSTPAVSAIIREREKHAQDGASKGAYGGFILTASHNPGGIDHDCGIKYNVTNGGPAPESLTDAIYEQTKKLKEYKICSNMPAIDLGKVGKHEFFDGKFVVEVLDPTEDYIHLISKVFDFNLIKSLLKRSDFQFVYDGMHGVGGPYGEAIFHKMLGVDPTSLMNCIPKEDFGHGHPDPNLTYAEELVRIMGLDNKGNPLHELTVEGSSSASKIPRVPDFGAATDGDADRNMVLGRCFFVTPSDSLAIISSYATRCIPYFREGGLKAIARSMPTSAASDLVADKLDIPKFEVPTGWKFFGNLMDSGLLGKAEYSPLICGEESFGTGSSHIREKDGIWAILCWLSILAFRNTDTKPGNLVTVQQIVEEHWKTYGRNYYCRYDYESVETAKANKVTSQLTQFINENGSKLPMPLSGSKQETEKSVLVRCDEFEYKDSVDGSVSSHQGWRFLFQDGSRFVFRLSGTGSSGATIRLYLEKYVDPSSGNLSMTTMQALSGLVDIALTTSSIHEHTGMSGPTVIT